MRIQVQRYFVEWFNAARMGALIAPANNYLRTANITCPNGVEGIRVLSLCITHPPAELETDQELEALGALLGCLLIDSYQGAALERNGKHWLHLGRFGFFDPFHAMQQVLDAEKPLEKLRTELARAHQEARHETGIGRLVAAVHDIAERRTITIQNHFASTLLLRHEGADYELDLNSALKSVEGEDQATVAQVAEKLVQSVSAPNAEISDPEAIFPRLIDAAFLREPHAHDLFSVREEKELQRWLPADLRSLNPGIALSLVERSGQRLRFLKQREADADFIARALHNLEKRTPEELRWQARHGLPALHFGDGLDAARILLPRVCAAAKQKWQADVFAIPHRDQLYFAAAPSNEQKQAVADEHQRAPHRISARFFPLETRRFVALDAL